MSEQEFAFLDSDVVIAAKKLIGCRLVRNFRGRKVTVKIIETEAYHQSEPGCHAYKGPTARNIVMFGAPGLAYVYFIYGMYHCLNVVAEKEGIGAAVLIRAAEFADSKMGSSLAINGGNKKQHHLAGPGRLCRELDITRAENGINLLDKENGSLWLLPRKPGDRPILGCSKRIGLSMESDLEWRFYEIGNPRISGPKR
ncbi:MAG: DNA-3-methyladenine glycosylase [bacterium]|jgi:DNA-3-methyladenine glycosylase